MAWGCLHPHLQDWRDLLLEEKGGVAPGLPSSLFSLSSFPLSLVYPRSFPWFIKGKTGHPREERLFKLFKVPREIIEYFNSTSPSPETWDPFPLSPIYNPNYKHQC
jgi:hypothetical protein